MRSSSIGMLVALALGGCDPQAKPADVARADLIGSGGLSREREACAASADCLAPLRCVRGTCVSPQAAPLGEYHWMAGEVAAERGDLARAVEAFQEAIAEHEKARVDAPPGLLCSYGAALRRTPGDPKAAEQAARLLHRCFLGSPPGSPDRHRALRELAHLEALGLDPAHLGRDGPADTYLTRTARTPSADALKVEVARTTPARQRGYGTWVEALEGAEARPHLARCFGEYWVATQAGTLTVPLAMRYRARYDDYDDVYLGGTLEIAAPDGAAPAGTEGAAHACVREALAPVAEAYGKRERSPGWTGQVAVTISLAR
jgi:hypothetical protein